MAPEGSIGGDLEKSVSERTLYIIKQKCLSVCSSLFGGGMAGGGEEGGQEGGGNGRGISQMECLGEDTFPEQCRVTS